MEKSKDVMMLCKSVSRGKNSKGGDRVQLSLSQDEAAKLAEALANLLSNERGVKLDIHVSKKKSQFGKEFDSGIFFIKAIQDPSSFQKGPKSFKEKDAASAKDKIAAIQAKLGVAK